MATLLDSDASLRDESGGDGSESHRHRVTKTRNDIVSEECEYRKFLQ